MTDEASCISTFVDLNIFQTVDFATASTVPDYIANSFIMRILRPSFLTTRDANFFSKLKLSRLTFIRKAASDAATSVYMYNNDTITIYTNSGGKKMMACVFRNSLA